MPKRKGKSYPYTKKGKAAFIRDKSSDRKKKGKGKK